MDIKTIKYLKFQVGIIFALLTNITCFSVWGKYHLCCFDCGDNHNNQMRASTERILYSLFYKTNAYGTHSVKNHCIFDLNQFKRIFPNLSKTGILIQNLNH